MIYIASATPPAMQPYVVQLQRGVRKAKHGCRNARARHSNPLRLYHCELMEICACVFLACASVCLQLF
jgi:hypothetical protein